LVGLVGLGSVAAVQSEARRELDRKNRLLAAANDRIIDANTALTTANAALDLQRQRAEDREAQAIAAVKRFGDAVSDNRALKNAPALESLRKELLREPLAFFKALRDRLQADHDTRPASLSRLAAAYFELGYLVDEIGDKQDALKVNLEALAMRQKLARDHPESADFASKLGGSLNNLAMIDLDAQRFAEARQRLHEAISWQKKALAAYPKHPTYRQFLANHLTHLVRAARGLARDEEAAAVQRELDELKSTDPAFIALDDRLAAVLMGEPPRNNGERLALAQRAYKTKRYTAAATLREAALTFDPGLAADRGAQPLRRRLCRRPRRSERGASQCAAGRRRS
jgi:hypothetical protein